jgi:hypothetical protein
MNICDILFAGSSPFRFSTRVQPFLPLTNVIFPTRTYAGNCLATEILTPGVFR